MIEHKDKFDDVVKEEAKKTLITKTDSTFIIEEKGKQPVVYYILDVIEEGTHGSKDNIVNLVEDVYRYQTSWCVVRYDMLDKYREAFSNFMRDGSDENRSKVGSFWIFATHRTVTTQYTGEYQTDVFWLKVELSDNKLGKDIYGSSDKCIGNQQINEP